MGLAISRDRSNDQTMVSRNENQTRAADFFDFSDIEGDSSIGRVGMVTKASADRLKGLLNGIIENRQYDIVQLMEILSIAEDYVQQNEKISRYSIRVVMTGDALQNASPDAFLNARLEACIPVGSSGNYLAYFGHNRTNRDVDADGIAALRDDVNAFRSIPVHGNLTAQPKGYEIRMIDSLSDDIREALIPPLMGVYKYACGDATRIAHDPDIKIAVAIHNDVLVGMDFVEFADVDLGDGQSIRIAELTDAWVNNDHKHNNIYYFMAQNLLADERVRDADVVFAESVITPQAIKTMNNLSLSFSSDLDIGMGILPNHAIINGLKSLVVVYADNTGQDHAAENMHNLLRQELLECALDESN